MNALPDEHGPFLLRMVWGSGPWWRRPPPILVRLFAFISPGAVAWRLRTRRRTVTDENGQVL